VSKSKLEEENDMLKKRIDDAIALSEELDTAIINYGAFEMVTKLSEMQVLKHSILGTTMGLWGK
jgi:hypothetical protein